MDQILKELSPYIVPVLIAVLGYIANWIKLKEQDRKLDHLQDIIRQEGENYYIICDRCGNRIKLSKASLYAGTIIDEQGEVEK